MIKRIFNFNKHDWRHLYQLLCVGIKERLKGNLRESSKAFYWVKIHLGYDSTKVGRRNPDVD